MRGVRRKTNKEDEWVELTERRMKQKAYELTHELLYGFDQTTDADERSALRVEHARRIVGYWAFLLNQYRKEVLGFDNEINTE